MPTETSCETPYLVTDDIEAVVRDLQINPYSLVVAEESPEFLGELVFQPLQSEQIFFEQYRDWLSRYLILNQPFVLPDFVEQLERDGYTVLFGKSCQPILDGYERWKAPLDIEGFQAPNGGSLYPYQSFSLRRAIERVDAPEAPDRTYFCGWCPGAGKSVFACAGAQELTNMGEVDLVLAFTLMKLKTNLAHFFQATTTLETVVNDGPAAKRKARYEKGSQVFVLNYDKAWADFEYLLPLVTGKRVLFILDECQKVLTDGTQNRSRKHLDKLIQASEPIIWPMSATVVSHSPFKYRDVFSIGGFRRNPLGTKSDFELRYVKQRRFFQIKTKRGGSFQQIFYDWDLPKLHEIRHRIADRCHNVRKTDPGIKENFKGMQTVVIPVQMSKEDRELYDLVCEHARGAVEREESLAPYYRLLRYICNTPESLQHTNEQLGQALSQSYPKLASSDHCAKLEMLLDQVESIRDSDDKVVVFCQWTHLGVLLLERHLAARKIRYVLHYGVGQSDAESQRAQREFKSDPDITVFLSSDAGAWGLSFQEARYVINYDVPYSYDILTQRSNRIDRADSYLDGLTSYVYVTEDTVEERIWAQNNQRRELASATLGTSEVLSYGSETEPNTLQWLIFGKER